jgi:predicted lipoprotein with Yx(FWY)xxD motif
MSRSFVSRSEFIMNIKTKWILGTSSFTIVAVGLLGLQACSSSTPDSTTPVDSAGASSAGASSSSAGASVSSAGAAISGAGDGSITGTAGSGLTTGGDTSGGSGGDTFGGSGGDTSGGSGGVGGSGGASGSSGAGGTSAATTTFTLQTSGTLGQVLATSTGMTLYVYGSDTPSTTAPTSACTGGCLTTWPIYDGDPATVPASLTATDFSTFSNGGSTQSTYQGWPLYTYTLDTAAGQTNGNGVGAWHAVTIPFTAP